MKTIFKILPYLIILIIGMWVVRDFNKDAYTESVYNDSINVLLSNNERLKTAYIVSEQKIKRDSLALLVTGDEMTRLKNRFEAIRTAPPRTVVIRDTIKYIQDCERDKELLTNALEQVHVLETRGLIYENIVENQSFLISNLKTQNKNLEKVIGHKNEIIEIKIAENRKLKRQRNIALIGGGVAVVLGILK